MIRRGALWLCVVCILLTVRFGFRHAGYGREGYASTDIREVRENCRLLGVVNHPQPDVDVITTLLKGFRSPSYPQDSGWSLAAYSNYETGGYLGIPNRPMIVRSQVPILDDHRIWNSVSELIVRLEPEIVIGHLRNASSGCMHIADPHPFEQEYLGKHYLMIHNGGIWGKDLEYLTGTLMTSNAEPVNCPGDPIDSEYVFLYLMERVKAHDGDTWSAIHEWASTLAQSMTRDWNAMNIIFTDGHILWAVRMSYRSDRFTLQYKPVANSTGYAVSTQALGPGWTPLPNFCLAEFRAGHPAFLYDIPHQELDFYLRPNPVMNPDTLTVFKPGEP
ncbi:class II glutamine amidotransferase [bacterium]|nr:class II glutamine amidotransferase [candidate division CSSED10-310 bacterium]